MERLEDVIKQRKWSYLVHYLHRLKITPTEKQQRPSARQQAPGRAKGRPSNNIANNTKSMMEERRAVVEDAND